MRARSTVKCAMRKRRESTLHLDNGRDWTPPWTPRTRPSPRHIFHGCPFSFLHVESQGSTQVYRMLSLTIRCTSIKKTDLTEHVFMPHKKGALGRTVNARDNSPRRAAKRRVAAVQAKAEHRCKYAQEAGLQKGERAKSPGRAEVPRAWHSEVSAWRRQASWRATARAETKKRPEMEQDHAAESDDEDDDKSVVPFALRKKIAKEAQQQQDEEYLASFDSADAASGAAAAMTPPHPPFAAPKRDDDSDEEEEAGGDGSDDDDDELANAGEYYEDVEELELDESDQKAMDMFFGGGAPQQTLADVIMAKIHEKEASAAAARTDAGMDVAGGSGGGGRDDDDEVVPDLPPKVLEVYQGVGKLLATYRSGKLPKAFKIVPRLANWEEVLYATDPDGWSPAATCAATKLFASNLNQKMAQRFYNLVLLPAVQVGALTTKTRPRARAPDAQIVAEPHTIHILRVMCSSWSTASLRLSGRARRARRSEPRLPAACAVVGGRALRSSRGRPLRPSPARTLEHAYLRSVS